MVTSKDGMDAWIKQRESAKVKTRGPTCRLPPEGWIYLSVVFAYFVRNSRIVADEFGKKVLLRSIFAPPWRTSARVLKLTQKIKELKMNDLIKNPILAFLAGLLLLWLVFKVLKVFISMFWIFVLAFIILYFVNDRFRRAVRIFLHSIFRR